MDKAEVIKKLKNYNENDFVFLKLRWNKLIDEDRLDIIENEKGVNPQVVYNILETSKIKSIKLAKYEVDRYVIRLKHSRRFDICIIIKFDKPTVGDLGIVTYYKEKIKER